MANGLSNLFENKMFLQLLGAAGADISSGQPLGANLYPAVMQNIAAQNYAKLQQRQIETIGKMLRGEAFPEGSAVKMNSKGMTINLPDLSKLKEESLGLATEGSKLPGASGKYDWAKEGIPAMLANPFAGSQLSGADLAGLTPQDIASSLAGAVSVEALGQKKVSDLVDMIYKSAQVRKMEEPEPLFPVPVYGIGQVPRQTWSALPDDYRDYSLYRHLINLAGGEGGKPMSFEEYRMLTPTDREKFVRALMRDPKLRDAALELEKAGAFGLGELAPRAAETAMGKQIADITGPGYVEEVTKRLSTDKITWANPPNKSRYVTQGKSPSEAIRMAREDLIIETIDRDIRSRFDNVEIRPDGWYSNGKLIVRNPYYGK